MSSTSATPAHTGCASGFLPAFEQVAMQVDIEGIDNFTASYRNGRATSGRQLALL
jgi:hypothetical protein